ncbi:MAG TPA: phosphatidylserine decarboxylase family protein [Dissulfurispiraceae bacterium]|nr:phosphatidylserine decarboxylase family protein [Dissulfurispiraceae bacterium]
MKFAEEGYPFIGFFAIVTAAVLLAWPAWIALLPLALTLFMAYFFRDPDRSTPGGEDLFVSPADGKVIVLQTISESQFIKSEMLQISIFMSPLDVHVNRAPCDGVVNEVVHSSGKFLSAFKPEASLQNENIAMTMDTKYGTILVKQIAGFVARRAVCRVSPGDSLKKGERYGVIKFSSRVDIFLPLSTVPMVKLGDIVTAGETILGHIQH